MIELVFDQLVWYDAITHGYKSITLMDLESDMETRPPRVALRTGSHEHSEGLN